MSLPPSEEKQFKPCLYQRLFPNLAQEDCGLFFGKDVIKQELVSAT